MMLCGCPGVKHVLPLSLIKVASDSVELARYQKELRALNKDYNQHNTKLTDKHKHRKG